MSARRRCIAWWAGLLVWVGLLWTAGIVGYVALPNGLGEDNLANILAIVCVLVGILVFALIFTRLTIAQRAAVRQAQAFVSAATGLSQLRLPARVLINGQNFDRWFDSLGGR